MKLYHHPISTTCRPIVLLAKESGIELDYQVVDLMTGAQYQPEFEAINPVPPGAGAGGWGLSADRELGDPQVSRRQAALRRATPPIRASGRASTNGWTGSTPGSIATFPTDSCTRRFSRSCALPTMWCRPPRSPVAARSRSAGSRSWISTSSARATISCAAMRSRLPIIWAPIIVVGGEAIGENFSAYPNIARWLGNMKALRSWQSVNAVFYQYMVEPNKGKSFVGL